MRVFPTSLPTVWLSAANFILPRSRVLDCKFRYTRVFCAEPELSVWSPYFLCSVRVTIGWHEVSVTNAVGLNGLKPRGWDPGASQRGYSVGWVPPMGMY